MISKLKLANGIFLNFALLINATLAQLPTINFELPVYLPWTPVQSADPSGWTPLSGSPSIYGHGRRGDELQSLMLPSGAPETAVRRNLTWPIEERTAFIDFKIRPSAQPEGSLANFVADGSQLAYQIPTGSNTGQLWVFHGSDGGVGSAQWFVTPGNFNLLPGSSESTTLMRITLRQDYDRNLWDLFIDGKLAAVNLAFEARGANLTGLEFYGGNQGDTFIDDLSAQPTNMLFPDEDKDGLPNDWESANGSNPSVYDRDQINPITGKSFLDSYLDSVWSAGSQVANGTTGIGRTGSIPPLTLMGSHQAVGALKGSLSVGGDGSGAYQIPIDLPKGTGGMEPKISLGYSSGGGNGIAGLGWGFADFNALRGAHHPRGKMVISIRWISIPMIDFSSMVSGWYA